MNSCYPIQFRPPSELDVHVGVPTQPTISAHVKSLCYLFHCICTAGSPPASLLSFSSLHIRSVQRNGKPSFSCCSREFPDGQVRACRPPSSPRRPVVRPLQGQHHDRALLHLRWAFMAANGRCLCLTPQAKTSPRAGTHTAVTVSLAVVIAGSRVLRSVSACW